MIFKSVARVNDDRPETHKLRLDDDVDLAADDDDEELLVVLVDSAIAQSHFDNGNSKMVCF